jgi:hypothetical protein
VLQTGQRIGAAAGIAATGSVFYGALRRGGPPHWDLAFRQGLLVIILIVGLSLLLALADALTGCGGPARHARPRQAHVRAG